MYIRESTERKIKERENVKEGGIWRRKEIVCVGGREERKEVEVKRGTLRKGGS